jgi:hypothetical protein
MRFWSAAAAMSLALTSAGGAECPIVLRDVTAQTGIQFRHDDGSGGAYRIVEYVSAGLALFDYDNDGLIDSYFLNGAPADAAPTGPLPKDRLYRNLGGWRFADVTDEAGLGDTRHGLGVAAADYDNDGFQDLYVNNYGPNVLYHNNGDGTFADATAAASVENDHRVGAAVCFLDADRDGLLDLFVGNYVKFASERHGRITLRGISAYPSPLAYEPDVNTFYRNNGDGTFTDLSLKSGIGLHKGAAMGAVCADYDNDGDTDIFVCNDMMANFLFENDGTGTFTEVALYAGTAYDVAGKAQGSMGVDCADYDNDGWLDFYMAGNDTIDRLWRNDSGRFTDVTRAAGWPSDPYPTEGVAWADFDNDGWVDLYCANYENWETQSYYPDRLYQNRQGVFLDVTKQAGIAPPYGRDLAGRGVNWGDYNNDGFEDCYVSDYRLCENLFWVNNHDSTLTNRAGELGVAGDEAEGAYGHTIGSEWGDYDNDGDLDLFCANLAHPRYIEFSNRSMLYENLLTPTPGPSSPTPLFIDRRAQLGIRYEETHSDPAWADVDNDGDLDLYITSIYEGRRSFLYLNNLRDSTVHPAPSLFSDITWTSGTRVFNGWGCAFADFDNDGDMDLVVGSGSGLKLFRSETGAPADFNGSLRHWLEVKVVGTKANRAGIGARVTVTQGRNRQIREVEGGKGTTSQNSLVQHFGLGTSAAPVAVEVRFSPSSVVTLKGIKPDQLIEVKEP